jgi:hypothetical protein
MNDFDDALSSFRRAMIEEGQRSQIPNIHAILESERPSIEWRLRWAAVVVLIVLALAAIPRYLRERQLHRKAAEERADAMLSAQIDAGLSHSVSRAFLPLMGSAPASAMNQTVDIRRHGR